MTNFSKAHRELAVGKERNPDFPIVPNVQGSGAERRRGWNYWVKGEGCFAALVFQLCVQNRYKLNKKLPLLEEMVAESPGDIHLQTRLAQARKAADIENQENQLEQRRQTGRRLLYGQVLQLQHAYTSKYLHVNSIQTSATEASNLIVELRSENAKSCLWKIRPRFKVKSEGDIVQAGDQVVLESVKSSANFLHVSSKVFGGHYVTSDCFELNLSASFSGLTSTASVDRAPIGNSPTPPNSPPDTSRAATSSVSTTAKSRLTSLSRALLTPKEDPVHLRIRRQDQSRPKTIYPSTSAIVYWQLEKEHSIVDGKAVHWDDKIRLRHFVRRKYLTRDSSGSLSLTSNPQDPNTLFALHPVVKTREQVPEDAAIRIQHANSNAWLHGYTDRNLEADDGGASASASIGEGLGALAWTSAEARELGLVEAVQQEDAFSLQIVEPADVANANFVAGFVPMFHTLGYSVGKVGERPDFSFKS